MHLQVGALLVISLALGASALGDVFGLGGAAAAAIGTGIATTGALVGAKAQFAGELVGGAAQFVGDAVGAKAQLVGNVFGFQGKREAVDVDYNMNLAKRYFALAVKIEKQSDCLTRAFCNIAAETDASSANSFQKAVQVLGERLEKQGESVFGVNSLGEAILYATFLGRKSHSQEACRLTYPKCTNKQNDATQQALQKYYEELL